METKSQTYGTVADGRANLFSFKKKLVDLSTSIGSKADGRHLKPKQALEMDLLKDAQITTSKKNKICKVNKTDHNCYSMGWSSTSERPGHRNGMNWRRRTEQMWSGKDGPFEEAVPTH